MGWRRGRGRGRWRAKSRRGRRTGLRWRLTRTFALVALFAVFLTAFLSVSAGFEVIGRLAPGFGGQGSNFQPPDVWRSWWTALDPAQQAQFSAAGREAGRALRRGAFLAAGLSFLVAVAAAALVTRQLTLPLARLADGARRLERGERGLRLPEPRRQDEVRDLTLAFNSFVGSLERQEAWRRALVADVAHDLRTPLSVMRAELEAMQDGLSAPDEAGLARLHGEVLLLARLVDDLRTLSLAEGDALSLRLEVLDAAEVLREVASAYRASAAASGSTLRLAISGEPLKLRADAGRLRQVLHNLLDNALRYGGGEIELGARREGGELTLWVRDHGPGLSEEALSRAFERFYRADAARTRDAAGRARSGLGLAIARALVEAQGGRIEAENAPGGGAVFRLHFPAVLGDR